MDEIQTFKTFVNDEEVEVAYYYDKGYEGSFYEPPEPESIEICEIMYKGVDAIYLINDKDLEKIKDEALANEHEKYLSRLEARAEEEYEQRKMEKYGY